MSTAKTIPFDKSVVKKRRLYSQQWQREDTPCCACFVCVPTSLLESSRLAAAVAPKIITNMKKNIVTKVSNMFLPNDQSGIKHRRGSKCYPVDWALLRQLECLLPQLLLLSPPMTPDLNSSMLTNTSHSSSLHKHSPLDLWVRDNIKLWTWKLVCSWRIFLKGVIWIVKKNRKHFPQTKKPVKKTA